MLVMSRPRSRIARRFSPRANKHHVLARRPQPRAEVDADRARTHHQDFHSAYRSADAICCNQLRQWNQQAKTALPSVRELLFEAVLAVATLTLWPILDERLQGTAGQRSRAMVYFPIVGFMLGVALAIVDRSAGLVAGPVGRSFAVLLAAAALSLGSGESMSRGHGRGASPRDAAGVDRAHANRTCRRGGDRRRVRIRSLVPVANRRRRGPCGRGS